MTFIANLAVNRTINSEAFTVGDGGSGKPGGSVLAD